MSPLTSSCGSSSTSPSSAASSFALIPQTHYLTDGIHTNRGYSSNSSLYSPSLTHSSGYLHGVSDPKSRITSMCVAFLQPLYPLGPPNAIHLMRGCLTANHRRYSSSASATGMLPPFRPSGDLSPVPLKVSTAAREQYAAQISHLHRNSYSQYGNPYHHQSHSQRSPIPAVSRNLESPFNRMSSSPGTVFNLQNPSMQLDTTAHFTFGSQSVPPFGDTRLLQTLQDVRGTPITPTIQAKVDKGFFKADQDWTCYRRNYFSVACSYSLNPETDPATAPVFLNRSGSPEQVQAMGMCITAKIDGEDGKTIELVQHTPKRDKGPMGVPEIMELSPHPTGNLGFFSATTSGVTPNSQPAADFDASNFGTNSQQGLSVANFDRIQFKKATANNGKRRAAQQYFHIVVELFARISKGQSSDAQWVKIASRWSAPMVVRGRSPGHYQDDRRNSLASMGPSGGSNGESGGGGPRDPGSTSTSGGPHGGMSGVTYPGSGRTGGSGGGYQAHHTSLTRSPSDNQSVPSSSSSSHGSSRPPFAERLPDPILTVEEANNIEHHQGYQYYPAPLFEAQMYTDASRPSLPPVRTAQSKLDGQSLPMHHENAHGFVASSLPAHNMQHHKAESSKGAQQRRAVMGFQAYQSPSFGNHWHTGSANNGNNGITPPRDCGRFQGVESSRGYYSVMPAL